MPRARTIDDYLAGLDDPTRAALQKVRAAIQAAAPRAEEAISYGIPAFRLDGTVLCCFKAAAHHCSFHPMSGTVVRSLAADLAGYDTSPGTVRFPATKPLPARLVARLVKARIAEREAQAARRGARAVRARPRIR